MGWANLCKQEHPCRRRIQRWARIVQRISRRNRGDYGQFLSDVGYHIAYKQLPTDVLDRFNLRITP